MPPPDLNTLLKIYLATYYLLSPSSEDLTSMVTKYLAELTQPEANARMLQLVDDAE